MVGISPDNKNQERLGETCMAAALRVGLFWRSMAVSVGLACPLASAQPATLETTLASAGTIPRTTRLEIVRSYCGAAVADAEYASANERMAMDFVAFDRARTRAGERWVYDATIKGQEAAYAKSFEWRLAARQRQRLHRTTLALLTGKPAPDEIEAPSAPALKNVPDAAALVPRLQASAEWRATESQPAGRREALRRELRVSLERLALALETLAKGTLPRVAREDEAAQLRLEKVREDTAQGQRGELGHAMAGTAETAWRRVAADCDALTTLAELEALLDAPASEWNPTR